MPKDISGTVPPSKSQRRKGARKGKPKMQHGGICSKCGQQSTSATSGSIHASCGEPLPQIQTLINLRASVLRRYLTSDGQGKWLSQSEHAQYKADIHTYQAKLRNFNTRSNRWENGLGQPINFHTREVLVHLGDMLVEMVNAEPLKVSVSVEVETTEVSEQKAA